MKDEFKVAAVFIGTVIGAGLASGQEIFQFFSKYGFKSIYSIILCMIFYIIFSIIFINLAYNKKFKNYNDLVCYSLGNKLGFVADLMITIFIFFSNTIMISGGGAMLNEYLGINKIYGIFIMATIAFLAAIFSTNGVIAVNSFIVPLSTSMVFILGLFVFAENKIDINIHSFNSKFLWSSAIIYAAFNFMTSIGVLYPMASEIKNKRIFIKGCILGSVVLTILALIINYNILVHYPGSFYSEVPNLYVAKKYGPLLPFYLTIIIWLEMFTTEVGCLYSLSKRLQAGFKIGYIPSLVFIISISIPFTFLGFANLIKLFYPPYGMVSIIILAIGMIKYLIFQR